MSRLLRFPIPPPVRDERAVDAPLRAAIAGRRLIQLRYEGKLRVAEPHDYGVQQARERLLIYQLRVDGGTAADARRARGWRLLDVAKIADCQVLEQTFVGSRGQTDQQHHAWDVLYARVE
jgi:hypothetical protein